MGVLFLLRDSWTTEPELARARDVLAQRGFRQLRDRTLDGWRMLHGDPMQGGPAAFVERGDDLVAVAGTLTFDGALGRPALLALLDHAAGGPLDRGRMGGHFAALLRCNGRTSLVTDTLGGLPLYRDTDSRVFSTAFLAAASVPRRLSLDPQGVYEYAFNAAPIGEDTVLSEIRTVGPDVVVDLEPRGARPRALPASTIAAEPAGSMEERVRRNAALLLDLARAQAEHFGDRIHVPLSGGIDSRLVLASLRAAGARPKVYVYGPPGLPDVAIAREIGAAEGFAVDWIDRSTWSDPDLDAFPHHVEEAFRRMDGLPNFGNIFDGGAGVAAQRARHDPGHLAVSGGGGEVYRDFFRLPDRPATVATVASTFFSRFCREDATDRFDPGAFSARIAAKLGAAIGAHPRDRVARTAIEQLYPRVRCRALFGREIALEAGYGSYFLPFLDSRVIAEGAVVPMAEKQTGRFEAALVAALDPALARHPSTYGHSFLEEPTRRRRFDEWLSRSKPAWLRRRSYALQRLAGRADDQEHGGPISDALISRVMDPEMPIMRRYFDIGRVARDHGLWYRVACLEYFAQRVLPQRQEAAPTRPVLAA